MRFAEHLVFLRWTRRVAGLAWARNTSESWVCNLLDIVGLGGGEEEEEEKKKKSLCRTPLSSC